MAVTDNFNRANGGLGANWTTDSLFSALTIVSNACKGGTAGVQNVATYTGGGTIPADQYAQCKVVTPGGFIGLVLRSNNAGTYYACFYPSSSGSVTMYRVTAGSFANITVGSTITPAANDIIYFEIVGSALTMKVNGVSVATATDGTFTSGYPGIDIFDNLGVIDDFEGGAAGVVNVTVNLTGVAASPAIGAVGFNVSMPLVGVAATPVIGTGTVTIGAVGSFATDDFNRANGAIGSNWSQPASSAGALAILGNQVSVSAENTHCTGFWSANIFTDDQYSQAKWITVGSGYSGLIVHADAALDRYYLVTIDNTSVTIYARWDGSYISLASAGTTTSATGDIFRLASVGSAHPITLTVYRNGVSLASWTSPSSTNVRAGGSPGIGIYSPTGAGLVLDDWQGGDTIVAVSVILTGVSASPAIGIGTVEITSVAPPVTPGGGTGAGRPARTGMRIRPTEDKAVYLKGVQADPKVGQVMVLHEMQRVYEKYSAPIPQKPVEMPPGLRGLFKKVEKPIPPALFVYQVGLPKLKSAVGTGKVNTFYEDIDEETIAMIDLL